MLFVVLSLLGGGMDAPPPFLLLATNPISGIAEALFCASYCYLIPQLCLQVLVNPGYRMKTNTGPPS